MSDQQRHTIYGLRIKGDREVRYVGLTNGSLEDRRQGHFNAAILRRHNEKLCDWLRLHGEEVEAFKIAYAETRLEAHGIERAVIALCLRLDQRLFNQRGVPAELKAVA